ncbi:guanosine monophosphate reductase [bacterium]|nr:guanosine monophosphate reductase [bacterium]
MKTYYTFNDIFLIPQLTDCESRSLIDTSTSIGTIDLNAPIMSANMDTITGPDMAIAMSRAGGTSALHRFNSDNEAVEEYLKVCEYGADCFVSVGVNDLNLTRATSLYEAGARHFIVDIAHGHSSMMRHTLKILRNTFGSTIFIVAGNVATPEAVRDLASWGADSIKVGIGGGSCCSTRVITGHGVPMFSCLLECSEEADKHNVSIIADGGLRSSGDIIKALAAGADYVMIGSLLSGTTETPGIVIDSSSGPVKQFRGMASTAAMIDRNHRSKADMPVGEGVKTVVPFKGPAENIIKDLHSGIRSGMSYMNAHTLSEIPIVARWGAQTSAGSFEGRPHILGDTV